MKPQFIKKRIAQRLRDGYQTDLMGLIEEGIDLYTEKTFNRGYNSYFDDASVHASRIVQRLSWLDEDVAKVAEMIIRDYFNELKEE